MEQTRKSAAMCICSSLQHPYTVVPEMRAFVPNLTCALCAGLLEDVVTIKKCDHYFCRCCLVDYYENQIDCKPRVPCPVCDRMFGIATEIKETSQLVRDVLSVFKLKCENEPCDAIIGYDDFDYHKEAMCPYLIVPCGNCEDTILNKEYENHTRDHLLKDGYLPKLNIEKNVNKQLLVVNNLLKNDAVPITTKIGLTFETTLRRVIKVMKHG